jgi:hypothetical protein
MNLFIYDKDHKKDELSLLIQSLSRITLKEEG